MAAYAICTEPRSGSNFLKELLTSTGLLGRPEEFFNTEHLRRFYPDYPDDPEAQLALIPTLGAGPNGVYGLKIFSWQFDRAAATRWAERLPDLSFVLLERRDMLGQAISHVRAEQTAQYTHYRTARGEAVYSGTAINQKLVDIARRRTRWLYYFARNGISPLKLVYEDAVDAPTAAAAAVCRHVGIEETPRIDLAALTVQIQRDVLTEDWRARYLAEHRDLAAFH